jgi:hypothetical protein
VGGRDVGARHPDRDAVEVGAVVEPDRHDLCVPRVTRLDRKLEVMGSWEFSQPPGPGSKPVGVTRNMTYWPSPASVTRS